MNEQGASKDPFGDNYTVPWPSSALFTEIFTNLGDDPDDFWNGNGGWAEIPYYFVKPQ